MWALFHLGSLGHEEPHKWSRFENSNDQGVEGALRRTYTRNKVSDRDLLGYACIG